MKKKVTSVFVAAIASLSLLLGSGNASADVSPYIGEVRWVAFNFAPVGWARCDGQLLLISQHTALFSIIGTLYGGDGTTTFALPDTRGRALMHAGAGPGLTPKSPGQKGGDESVQLTTNQVPSHAHQLNARQSGSDVKPNDRHVAGLGRFRAFGPLVAPERIMDAQALGEAGGSSSHNNMQPFVTANCIIALVGVFPTGEVD